jgi:radical SAM superfamily enzyme YgiQ (UPF0313 family)
MNIIFQNKDVRITLYKEGSYHYTKSSYPLRYGVYSQIEIDGTILQFNLNSEIIHAKSKERDWPHPQEWLKRTVGNDWIYYSTGGYTGVFEAIGEYYLPNTPYPTNSLIGGNPFVSPVVAKVIKSWYSLIQEAASRANGAPEKIRCFLDQALVNSPELLSQKAKNLYQNLGGMITVLPPDVRHVDYNIIPINVAEGCLYKCRFCRVKTNRPFKEKSCIEIDRQIEYNKNFYGEDLTNYNSLFLGEHDALSVRPGLLLDTIVKASRALFLTTSKMNGRNIFLFGSVDSLLKTPMGFFEDLKQLPCAIYINIGLESADQETLDVLGKPLTTAKIHEAFVRMQFINDQYQNIEITANFVMDENLPENHYPSMMRLVRDSITRVKHKGCIYLSPLRINKPSRSHLFTFNRFKLLSRLPMFLYIIQRL